MLFSYFEVSKRVEKLKLILENNEKTTLIFVFLGLMLDNLLLTVVVPIIPDHLYQIEHPDPCLTNKSAACVENADFEPVVRKFRPVDLVNENSEIGILFASKALVQLLVNPCVAVISARYGYSIPMFTGVCILFFSSTLFAAGSSYGSLFFARAVQGVGSSSLVISGMGLISSRYPDEVERSKNTGVALSGIAAGVLVGYPFGSIIYDIGGKVVPFLLISFFVACLAVMQLIGLPPQRIAPSVQLDISHKTLLKDPYILAITLAICISTSAMAILEPCLPLWLLETMDPEPWQLGTAFIPDSIGYFIGSSFFGVFALRVGRWKCSFLAMITVAISAICLPFARAIWHLILPHFGLGIGIGIVDAAFMPLLADLVDMRHKAAYGSVFAIAQIAVCSAYFLGPLLGGLIANIIGFPFLMRAIGVLNLLVSPICLYLRHVPSHPEHQALINRDFEDGKAQYNPMQADMEVSQDHDYNQI